MTSFLCADSLKLKLKLKFLLAGPFELLFVLLHFPSVVVHFKLEFVDSGLVLDFEPGLVFFCLHK